MAKHKSKWHEWGWREEDWPETNHALFREMFDLLISEHTPTIRETTISVPSLASYNEAYMSEKTVAHTCQRVLANTWYTKKPMHAGGGSVWSSFCLDKATLDVTFGWYDNDEAREGLHELEGYSGYQIEQYMAVQSKEGSDLFFELVRPGQTARVTAHNIQEILAIYEEPKPKTVTRRVGVMPRVDTTSWRKAYLTYRIKMGEEVVYVGKTKNTLVSRIAHHLKHKDVEPSEILAIDYCEHVGEADMDIYELYLINLHQPALNVTGKKRDELAVALPDLGWVAVDTSDCTTAKEVLAAVRVAENELKTTDGDVKTPC